MERLRAPMTEDYGRLHYRRDRQLMKSNNVKKVNRQALAQLLKSVKYEWKCSEGTQRSNIAYEL